MNTKGSTHRFVRYFVAVISQISIVFGFFGAMLMPIPNSTGNADAFVDPIAAYSTTGDPSLSNNAWILALPARQRFLAEKLTRLEQLEGTVVTSQATIPEECTVKMSQQQIAALAAQTGVDRLSVFKALQANCFPYTGNR